MTLKAFAKFIICFYPSRPRWGRGALLAAACFLAIPAFGFAESEAANLEAVKPESSLGKLDSGAVTRTLRVSHDGTRFAYMAKLEDGTEAVFVNDKQSPKYTGIVNESLSFSPDSKRVSYGALRNGNKVVVVDNTEYPAFNGSAEGMPVWSSDSKRFAFFAATDEGRILAVVDGKAGQAWDSVIQESFTFSPEGSRFAFVAKDGDFGRVVVDGEAGSRYRNVAGFTFSPNGKHFAYIAILAQSMAVIVDGVETVTARAFIKDTLRFDGSKQLHVVKLEGNKLILVQTDLVGSVKSDGLSRASTP